MNHRKKILLADNSSEYRRSVIGFLELEGYFVVEAGTQEEAQQKLEDEKFHLVLADLRMRNDDELNDMSGLEIAKFASQCGIPCIIVTAFPTVELARIALRSRSAEPFAQDLITKASGPQALIDSIRLTLQSKDSESVPPVDEGLVIDLDKELVRKNGSNVDVPPKQFRLLAELRRKDGGVCSCVELIRAIYQEELGEKAAQNDRRLRNLVDRTKDKIEDKGSGHEYIEAVSGRGYRLNLKK
jgi:DNA-binding response OmpR family regulator